MHLTLALVILLSVVHNSFSQEVVYYVTPDYIPCSLVVYQPCVTLEYLIDNVDLTINRNSDVTMIFLQGIHLVNNTHQVNFVVPNLKFIAKYIDTDFVSVYILLNSIGIHSGTTLTFDHVSMIIELNEISPPELDSVSPAFVKLISAHYWTGTITMNNSQLACSDNFSIGDVFMDISSSNITFNGGTFNHTVARLDDSVVLTIRDCKV